MFFKKNQTPIAEALSAPPPEKTDPWSRLNRIHTNICLISNEIRHTAYSHFESSLLDLHFLQNCLMDAEKECEILLYDTPPGKWLEKEECQAQKDAMADGQKDVSQVQCQTCRWYCWDAWCHRIFDYANDKHPNCPRNLHDHH